MANEEPVLPPVYSTTRMPGRNAPRRSAPSIMESAIRSLYDPVPGESQICRHLRPRVQDELSQSFDFLIFKHGNQIQTGRSKGELVRLTR